MTDDDPSNSLYTSRLPCPGIVPTCTYRAQAVTCGYLLLSLAIWSKRTFMPSDAAPNTSSGKESSGALRGEMLPKTPPPPERPGECDLGLYEKPGGKIIVPPDGWPAKHECDPPSPWGGPGPDGWAVHNPGNDAIGMVWRCDCGQDWLVCDDPPWACWTPIDRVEAYRRHAAYYQDGTL